MEAEKEALIRLLQASLIPDTAKVAAAEKELKAQYYAKPAGLLLLIEVFLTHEDAGIRQSAATQSRPLVFKLWRKVDNTQKVAVRHHLLDGLLKETRKSNVGLGATLIAAIASEDLAAQQGHEILQAILALNNSSDVRSRELGSLIVHELLEIDPSHFADDVADIIQLLNRNIHDPESREVRLNAARTIWSVLMLVGVDDNTHVQAVQNLIPPVVNLLKEAVAAEDETAYQEIFQALGLFLTYGSIFMAPHIPELLQFMVEMATNREIAEDVRVLPIDFIGQCLMLRRMRTQAMKDVGAFLVTNMLKVITELEPSDDEEDEDDKNETAASAATILIDNLSTRLPPRQVIVPLLDEFAKYSVHSDPAYRRAGILSVGYAAEGAPDFLATQLDFIIPKVLALLQDGDDSVRNATLAGLTYLADHLSEPLAQHHESLVAALLQNIEAALQAVPTKRNIGIVRTACAALERIVEGIDSFVLNQYGPRLIISMGKLLGHESHRVKAAATSAIGAIAESLGKYFQPFFNDVITALAPFVRIKGSTEALALRSSACNTMGRIAAAVGGKMFQSYLLDLMNASEESLELEGFRLKETSFLLWSQLSKVFEDEFRQYLPGVFKALFQSLEQVEKLDDSSDSDNERDEGGNSKSSHELDAGMISDDESLDEDDFYPITDIALEKEVAIEAFADVVAYSCGSAELEQYVKDFMTKLETLTKHTYEGCRKTAISAIWRIYARAWHVWEKETGNKWQPGLASNSKPVGFLLSVGIMAENVTMRTWRDDLDSAVITEINSSIAATLKACGPSILMAKEGMVDTLIEIVGIIITRSHPCQVDMGDEEEEQAMTDGSSEMDWLVVDTALDVVIGLAAALGTDFVNNIWKNFEQPIMKYVSSTADNERATAVGVIAEIIKHSGSAVTPHTQLLQTLLNRRIGDPDPLTKSNAVYGMGQLILCSDDTNCTIPTYEALWDRLEQLLGVEGQPHLRDNTCGCLARMMLRNPDAEFVSRALPKLVGYLPLQKDHEENEPVYQCIYKLYEQGNPTVQQLTIPLLSVFEQVLGAMEDQIDDDTRKLVQQTVQMLFKAHPEAFHNNPNLPGLAGIA